MRTAVTFVDARKVLHSQVQLVDVVQHDFVGYQSVRSIPAYKGQGHLPGIYWFSSINRLVPYESRLEMFTLMKFDFDQNVIDVLSQPFLLHFSNDAEQYLHIPDFLVWRDNGEVEVVDVKPARQFGKASNLRAFESTRLASQRLGWGFQVYSELDPLYLANLKWLAGYRRRPPFFDTFAEQVIEALETTPRLLGELVHGVGTPVLVRVVVFHLLWLGVLKVDMTQLLGDSSIVYPASGRVQ